MVIALPTLDLVRWNRLERSIIASIFVIQAMRSRRGRVGEVSY